MTRRSARGSGRSVLHSTTAIAVMATLVALTMVGLSYLTKTPCLDGPYRELGQAPRPGPGYHYCYSDIQQLWVGRGIAEGMFPYVKGWWSPEGGPQGTVMDGSIEYPVVTGLFMWLTKQPSDNVAQYMRWTVLLMAPFAAAAAVMLARLSRWRVFIWAAAPTLLFYAAYNWDLLPVGMCVGAVYAWSRGRSLTAAALFGLGAATKIYPGFFLVPLTLERLLARDPRGAAKVAAPGAGTWLAVNLPFILINWDGWFATYRFQLGRAADIITNSIYYWGMPHLPTAQVDHLSLALMGTTWLVAFGIGWRRTVTGRRAAVDGGSGDAGAFPWLQVGAGMLAGFLAFNKVYSPQYSMWLLPFLVLIRVRWGWWVSYWVVDVLLTVGTNVWFWEMGHDPRFTLAKQATVAGVWGKTILLSLLVVALARAPLAFERQARRAPAEPGAVPDGDLSTGDEPSALSTEGGTGRRARPIRAGR